MHAGPPEVVIRPPLLARIWVVGFTVFWVGKVIWTTMIRHHHVSSVVVGVLFVAIGITFAYRLLQLGVRSKPDGSLTIRNNFGARRLTRSDIEAFRASRSARSWLAQRSVYALLRDGTVCGIDVCRGPSVFGKKRAETQLAQLNRWLDGAP